MCVKTAGWEANSVDPDQTLRSATSPFLIWVYTVRLDLSVPSIRVITVRIIEELESHMSRATAFPTRSYVCLARTQISLRVRTGCSVLLSSWRVLGFLAIHRLPCEDSDQTVRMRRLIWILAERTCNIVGNRIFGSNVPWGICWKRRFRPACSSALSDRGLRWPDIESLNAVGYSGKYRCIAKTHIRLCGFAGWSGSSLFAYAPKTLFLWRICLWCYITQWTRDVSTTSPERWCNVTTLHRRLRDAVYTSCARWV